jgi:hypothetical protein
MMLSLVKRHETRICAPFWARPHPPGGGVAVGGQPPSHRRYEARADYFGLMKIFFIFCQIVLLIGREFRQPTGVHDGRRESPALAIISFSGWRRLRLNPMVLYRLLFLFLECRTRMGLTAKTAPQEWQTEQRYGAVEVAMPRPVAVMATTASWEVGLRRMLKLSPPGMAFKALSRRFRNAWVNQPGRPWG